MDSVTYFKEYFDELSVGLNQANIDDLVRISAMAVAANAQSKKTILVGNGGSAAMASHVAVDLVKAAGIRAINFNEADLITCFATDLGTSIG